MSENQIVKKNIVHLAEASEGLVVTFEFRQDNGRVEVAFRHVTPSLPKGDQRGEGGARTVEGVTLFSC